MTLRAGALGLVLVCALTGCSGDSGGEPQSLPPVTPAPTTLAPSPTTSPSAYPQTPQGAADFARFVNQEINRAYVERDPDVVRSLFGQACVACARYLRTLERLQGGTVSVEGASSELLSAETPGGTPVVVIVRSRFSGATFRDPAGTVTGREEPGLFTSEITLERRASSWAVSEITDVRDGG